MRIRNLRQAATGALVALAIVFAGCASMPEKAPVTLSGDPVKFNTGNVTLYVTDYVGTPLRQAWVDIESEGNDMEYFRNAGTTDYHGKVTFRGVPEHVRISVNHNETRAFYSRAFAIPSTGSTELRMMLETLPTEPRATPQPVPQQPQPPVPRRQ